MDLVFIVTIRGRMNVGGFVICPPPPNCFNMFTNPPVPINPPVPTPTDSVYSHWFLRNQNKRKRRQNTPWLFFVFLLLLLFCFVFFYNGAMGIQHALTLKQDNTFQGT